MFYYLFFESARVNLFGYITFRTAAASMTAFALSILLGPWMIRRLRDFQVGQVIRTDGPASHRPKAGTPTMGGLLILASVIIPTLLWTDPFSPHVWVAVGATALFGAVGFVDDYLKITRHSHHGLFARYKFASQIAVAIGVGVALVLMAQMTPDPNCNTPTIEPCLYNTKVYFPFFKQLQPDIGWWYVPFAVLVLVASTNTVNLTDGLDGLAISTFAVSAGAYTALAYVTGHAAIANFLLIPHFEFTSELTIFCGSLVGASLGFLWWNAHPADIFMGDVGSLGLGGALGSVALLTKQEMLLPIVGGVFVLEGLSVIAQVASFKLTGKRVLRMAPLHHHFELIGWPEPKVITRFLILAILFALFSLTTLKLR
jgi:phospho-N-acetylmuramoyl-pentapeptide-transferase